MSNRRKVKQIRATWNREPGIPHHLKESAAPWGRREIRGNDTRVPLAATLTAACVCGPGRDGWAVGCPNPRHAHRAALRELTRRGAS